MSVVILILQLLIIPNILGRLFYFHILKKPAEKNGLIAMIYGYILEFALFWICYIPCMLLETRFFILLSIFTALILLLTVVTVVLEVKRTRHKDQKKEHSLIYLIRTYFFNLSLYEIVYLIIFIVMLGTQVYFSATYTATNQTYDDFEYIVQANDNVASDSISNTLLFDGQHEGLNARTCLNSWMAFISYLSITSETDVATVAHTVIPVIFLIVAYAVYGVMSSHFFEKQEERLLFMDILSIGMTFGLYSHNALSFRLQATLWQGKAMFAAIIMPLLFVEILEIYSQAFEKANLYKIIVLSIAGCTFTLLGSGLMAMFLVLMWFLMCIHNKKLCNVVYTIAGCMVPAIQVVMYIFMNILN